jgi:hypothetical protein
MSYKKLKYYFILTWLVLGITHQTSAQVYFFSPKYFSQSFDHELGITFLTGYIRSPNLVNIYTVENSVAYPEPVYMRSYPILTISYEPQFRLLEIGHNQSFSLNLPVAVSLSTMDLRTNSAIRYSTDEPSQDQLDQGKYYETRDLPLGTGHGEFGGLISYNVGVNSTAENTWPVGFNIAFGYNYIYGPLIMTSIEATRTDYIDYLRWGHWVGRLGFHGRRIGVNYMLGLNQETLVFSSPGSSYQQTLEVGIYHRMAFTINL